jgi:multidrug efflux pump subunit AcrA (membrane-fusion protein)
VTHRTDAEGSIRSARDTLAELDGRRTPTDITIANAARAQAIATAAVSQAILALADTLTAAQENASRS